MEQDKEAEKVEDRSQDNLDFNEVLHLLSKKAVLGRGIPEKYNIPPWRLPESTLNYQEINSLLQQSMMAQAGSIPGTEDFKEFILSNAR